MEPTNPADMTPAQVDTELARLSKIEWTAWRKADQYRRYAVTSRQDRMVANYQAAACDAEAEAAAARKEAQAFEAEFARRGGWNRYFLVTNAGGHVHRGMNCSTCFATTEYAWLVDLADCDEAAMVAEYGEMACTVCFPDAPAFRGFADGTSAVARRTQTEKDARKAEKDARAAAKAAKAITAPDGSPLRGTYGVIRTKVAAQRALSEAVQGLGWYGEAHPDDFVRQIANLSAALGAAGVDPLPVVKRAKAKAVKDGATQFPGGAAA